MPQVSLAMVSKERQDGAGWGAPVTPAFGRLMQEGHQADLMSSLSSIVTLCLKLKKKTLKEVPLVPEVALVSWGHL